MTTQTKNIRYRPATDLSEFDPKRVAVYARVSRESEAKHHSIEMQKENLRRDVESHFGWQFAGYYVDEGVTGTKIDRPELNRLVHDAKSGKIDIILTKSVSRLGRNTVAVQKLIRELRSIGVYIIFSDNNINTADLKSTLYLNLLSVQAETEAKQTSDNVHWSIASRFAEGLPTHTRPYGYYLQDHKFHVVPEEAIIVKRIFSMYLSGMGRRKISRQLNHEGVPSLYGIKWSDNTIRRILMNEKYTGDLLLQKWYVPNYLTKVKRPNQGELPQYLIRDAHDPIIDRETFAKTQQEITRRAKLHGGTNKKYQTSKSSDAKPRVFTHLIRCGNCNKHFGYKRYNGGGYAREVWECFSHMKQGSQVCPVKGIREDILTEITRATLSEQNLIAPNTPLTNELLKLHLKQIVVNQNQTIEYHFHSNTITIKPWQNKSRKESWTPEMKQKAREKSLRYIEAQKGGNHND